MYCCGDAEESKGGDGDAVATVVYALKGGECEKEENADAAAALPHAGAVGARSSYCCGGERSVYCCGGVEESKGGGGEKKKNSDAAAALLHALAPVGAPNVYSCGGAEEKKRCNGEAASMFAHTRWRPWERQARRRGGGLCRER
jgi:hypothetical protein